MSKKNVIIFGGSISAWGVVQGLKKYSVNIYVVSGSITSIGASSKYVKQHFVVKTEQSDYVKKVLDIIDLVGGNPILMIAGDDHALEILSKNYKFLVERSIPTFQSWKKLNTVIDKNKLALAAQNIGLKPIPTVLITNLSELQIWQKESTDDFKNGYFLKCQDSISFKNKYGTKGVICNNKNEITSLYEKYNGFLGQLLIQKYIVGKIEELVAVLMIVDQHSNVVEYNIQKKLRAGGGRFGSTSLSVTLMDQNLLFQATKLVKVLKCIGPVGVQFKFDQEDQEYKIMEINSRFSVGVSLAVGAGDNLPLALLKSFNNEIYEKNQEKKLGYFLWNPLTDMTFLLSTNIFKGFLRNISIVNKPKLIVPLDRNDLKPFIIQFYMILKAILKRLKK